jgi:hypothetical protein
MPLVSVHLRKSKKNIIAFLETRTTITTTAAVVATVTEINVNKVLLEKHSIRKSSKKRQFLFFTDVNQEKKKKKKSLNDHIQKKSLFQLKLTIIINTTIEQST